MSRRIESQRQQWPHRVQRLAMPAPPPEELSFKLHRRQDTLDEAMRRTQFFADVPTVTAHLGDDPDPIGHLEWHGIDSGYPVGQVEFIHVKPEHRRSSVATSMFDWVKQNVEPRLHHSDEHTELGRQWVDHEQSRNARLATKAPPQGLRFEVDNPRDPSTVYAYLNGRWAGALTWFHPDQFTGPLPNFYEPGPLARPNTILDVLVRPGLRRQGIGTAMFTWAKNNANPDLEPGEQDVTGDYLKWTATLGHNPKEVIYRGGDQRVGSRWPRLASARDYEHEFGWAVTDPVGYRTPRWDESNRPVVLGTGVEPNSGKPKRYFAPYEKNPPANTYARPDPGAYFSPTAQPVLPGMMNDVDSEYGSDRDPLTLHRGFKLWLHDDGEHLAKIRRLLYGPEHEDDEAMWFNPHGGLSGQGGYDFMLPGMPANDVAAAPLTSSSPRFDHPDLPHHIFNHLLDRENKGLGTHWSTRFDTAAQFAGLHPHTGDAPIGSLPVIISGNWSGLGEDPYRHYTEGDFSDEHEITLIPGAPITPREIYLNNPETGRWHSHTLFPQHREARVLSR